MKKKTFIQTPELQKFLEAQSAEIRIQHDKIVERLEKDGFLVLPYGKKLSGYKNLFEIRITSGGSVRVFYCYQTNDLVIGVSGFIKKTQLTPIYEIKKALKIIKKLEA